MKRTVLPTALALILAGSVAFAQQTQTAPAPDAQQPTVAPHHHHHNPQREAARLSKKLNLSADQTAKIEPIFADRDQKMAALWQNTALTPQDKHQQMHAIHKATKQQLEAVLTPDQMQQMKAMHHEHRRDGQEQPTAPPPAA